jgi:hypothetical protein
LPANYDSVAFKEYEQHQKMYGLQFYRNKLSLKHAEAEGPNSCSQGKFSALFVQVM